MDQLSHDTRDENEFHSDQHNSSSGFEAGRPPLIADPCDVLLDAIDAQLGKLQVKHQQHDRIDSAPFTLSPSLSKDTGLGSTVSHTNDPPMSCLDQQVTPAVEHTADRTRSVASATHEVATWELGIWTSSKVQMESHKEQVMWRLEKLLGDTCKQGTMSSYPHPPSESICTEDFVRCFREEMVELALPEGGLKELDKDEEAERPLMTSDGDPCLSHQNCQNVIRSETTTNVKSSKDTGSVAFFQHEPEQHKGLNCPSETSGVQTSQVGEKRKVTDTKCQQDVSLVTCVDGVTEPSFYQIFLSVIYSTEVENEHRNPKHNSSPKAGCLAGAPVWNLDTVSVDSDLDSVSTDQVRLHLRRRAGAFQNKAQSTCRTKSLEDVDKDTDDESNGHWSRRSQLEKASEKMHSAWETMSERLSSLRQRCEKEEETLRMKKSHLTEVELSLSELQLRRKHAFHDLERLSAEAGHLETEKRQLEVLLKDCKAEIDSLSSQLQKLQRQKESCLCEVGHLQEERKKKEQLEQLSCVEKTSRAMSELERHGSLQTERDRLKGELAFLKSQKHSALKEAREHAHTMMEAALKQQRKDLDSVHEQQMQKLKKDEAKVLKNSLEHQKEESKKREEELHAQTLQKVHKAIDEQRRTWEADKLAALHFHCGLLEEQNRRSLETVSGEIHQEKSNALTLQRQVAELQGRVQELEAERCVQQREQESLLSAICRSLKQEQQDELDKLHKHMLQESAKTALQLERAVQQAEGETERIGRMLEEQQISYNEAKAEQEQQLWVWAQELVAEWEFLHLLIEKNGGQQNIVQLPPSATIDEALMQLKAQQDPLKHLIEYLQQQLDSQRQANEQLLKDKEWELRIHKEQMRTERNQALDSLKERLIQDHIEELSSLKWSHVSDGGLEASLRKQLEAKDMEMRQVQRNMSQWKEQTTARLACKFEEELTAELERKTSTNEEEKLRVEGRRKFSAKHHDAHHSDCLTYVYAAAPQSPSDVASLKLVHYLQSRVKQLRVENQTWMPTGPNLPTLNHQESRKA